MFTNSKTDAATGEVLLAFALQIAGFVFSGWVFTELWRWFIVPTFGAAPLRVPVAIGLLLVAKYATASGAKYDKSDPLASVLASLALCAAYLVIGFLVVSLAPR